MGGKEKGASLFKNSLPLVPCLEFRLSRSFHRANMALLRSLDLEQSPRCNPIHRATPTAYKFFKE